MILLQASNLDNPFTNIVNSVQVGSFLIIVLDVSSTCLFQGKDEDPGQCHWSTHSKRTVWYSTSFEHVIHSQIDEQHSIVWRGERIVSFLMKINSGAHLYCLGQRWTKNIQSWAHLILLRKFLDLTSFLILREKLWVRRWSCISKITLLFHCLYKSVHVPCTPSWSLMYLQENYLKTQPAKLRNEEGPDKDMKLLRLMDQAASSISDGDLVDAMIHG